MNPNAFTLALFLLFSFILALRSIVRSRIYNLIAVGALFIGGTLACFPRQNWERISEFAYFQIVIGLLSISILASLLDIFTENRKRIKK